MDEPRPLFSAAGRALRQWGRCALECASECALSIAFPLPRPDPDLLAPEVLEQPFCEICGEPPRNRGSRIITNTYTCTLCVQNPRAFFRARSGFHAHGQVLDAIISFKYHKAYYRRRQLVDWLVESYDRFFGTGSKTEALPFDGLIPVPLHPLRHRDRGFNQARILAEGLGRARGLPICDTLIRIRAVAPQTTLSRRSRLNNLVGVMAMKPSAGRFSSRFLGRVPPLISGGRYLLIDDIFTTGATIDACASVLRQHGADPVYALTIGRS